MKRHPIRTLGHLVFYFTVALLFQGCNKDQDGCRQFLGTDADGTPSSCELETPSTGPEGLQSTSLPSCQAIPSKTLVELGETLAVQLIVAGGQAPYSTLGVPQFQSSTTISRSFAFEGARLETIPVVDANQNATQCTFNVSVGSAGTDLACQISPAKNEIQVNESVLFNLSVNGTGAPYHYTFQTASPSGKHFATTEQSNITVSADYPSTGFKNTALEVRNSQGDRAICAQTIRVRDSNLSLSASPSDIVEIGQSVVVTATQSDFAQTPQYTFSTSEPGIALSQDGNKATVTVVDGKHHSFELTATASSQGTSVSETIALTFAGGLALACEVTSDGDQKLAGETVSVSVTSASGEALEITEIQPGVAGSVTAQGTNSASLSYTTGGSKRVSLRARSLVTQSECNFGSVLITDFEIRTPALCTHAAISPTTSTVGDEVAVAAVIESGTGTDQVNLDSITSDGDFTVVDTQPGEPLKQTITFTEAGTFPVTLTVRDSGDSENRTTTCTTFHTVEAQTPACTATFHDGTRPIAMARPRDPVRIRVDSHFSLGHVLVDPSADTHDAAPAELFALLPHLSDSFRYKEAGNVTATVSVTDFATSKTQLCEAPLTLADPLSCSISGPSLFTLHKSSHRGYQDSDAWISRPNYTATVQHEKPPVEYRIDNGDGYRHRTAATHARSKTLSGKHTRYGKFQTEFTVFDKDDRIGGQCSMDVTLNLRHDIHLHKPNNRDMDGTRCYADLTNHSNEEITVWLWGSDGWGLIAQDIDIPAGATRRSFEFIPHKDAKSCQVRLKIRGADTPMGALTSRACLKGFSCSTFHY